MGAALCKLLTRCKIAEEWGTGKKATNRSRRLSTGTTTSTSSKRSKTRSFRGQMMRKHKNRDVYKYYQVVEVAGEGSISTTQVVKRRLPRKSWGIVDPQRQGLDDVATRSKQKRVKRDLINRKSPPKLYALKTIHKNEVNNLLVDEMRNEISILKHIDHPNIVKVYESFERKRNLFLVMEYCSGGDLYERIPYTEADAAKIVRQILSAIAYLHKNKVVHRDIKFENILFENKTHDADVKLIDFGLSKKFQTDQRSTMTEIVGTFYTMSPQVLQGVYTSRADLWSIGVVTYMLLSGNKPFWGKKRDIISKITRCEYDLNGESWGKISNEAKTFVKSLLQMDQWQRPAAKQALKDPWFSLSQKEMHHRTPSEDGNKGNSTNSEVSLKQREINRCLINFSKSAKLKKLALMVVAYKSSMEEIVKLREVFSQYDSDSDGIITFSEFQKALIGESEYTEDELKSIFNAVDVNETGVIDFTEFIAATLETQGRIENEKLAEAFDRFDVDGSGSITKEDLREVLGSKCSEEMIVEILDEIDLDQDGEVSYEEFLTFFRVKRKEERDEAFNRSGLCSDLIDRQSLSIDQNKTIDDVNVTLSSHEESMTTVEGSLNDSSIV